MLPYVGLRSIKSVKLNVGDRELIVGTSENSSNTAKGQTGSSDSMTGLKSTKAGHGRSQSGLRQVLPSLLREDLVSPPVVEGLVLARMFQVAE